MTPLILFSLTSFPVGNFQLWAKVDVLVGLGTVLCVIFIILLVRAAMRGTVALRKTTHQAWQTDADDLGLAYQPADRPNDYLMEGTMAGFQVKVESTLDTHRQSAETKRRTAFTVDFPESLGLGLELTWQIPLIGGISKFFGAQDIVTGDEFFDKTFIVKGNDPDELVAFLGGKTRQQLVELHKTYGRTGIVEVTDKDISIIKLRTTRDADEIIAIVTDLTRAAFALAGHLAHNDKLV